MLWQYTLEQCNYDDAHGSTTWTRKEAQKVAFSHYFLYKLLIRDLDSQPSEVNGKTPMRLAGFRSSPEHQSEYVHEAGIEHELKGREGTTGVQFIATPYDVEE